MQIQYNGFGFNNFNLLFFLAWGRGGGESVTPCCLSYKVHVTVQGGPSDENLKIKTPCHSRRLHVSGKDLGQDLYLLKRHQASSVRLNSAASQYFQAEHSAIRSSQTHSLYISRRLDGLQITRQIFLTFDLFRNKLSFGNIKKPYSVALEFDILLSFYIELFT